MATIIDSFVTEFVLDATPYEEGQEAIRDATKKTREEVAGGQQDFDTYGKRASQFFSKLRNEAIGLFLAFQGASSIKGYLSDILTSDAATGRLARNIGMATQELSAWQMAIKTVGGTADDANAALSSIAEAYQSYLLTGLTGHDADFKGLGVTLKDLEDPAQTLLKMAEAAERMDQTEFYARMRRIGIPDAVINQLVKGRRATELLIEEKKKDGAATDANARSAEEFQVKLAELEAKIMGMVRPALYKLVDALLKFLDGVERGTIELPDLELVLGAVAIAAAAAGAPFVALAAAIAAVVTAYQNFKSVSAEESAKSGQGEGWGIPGLFWVRPEGAPANGGPVAGGGGGAGAAVTGSAASREKYIREYLKASGFTDEQTRGIMAGMYAENTSFDPNVRGGYKGRAVGVGQWLGPRRKKLLDRYGPNPTLRQQMAFLVEELKGGDPGGAGVRSSTTAEETASNYIGGEGWGFMRPGVEGRASDMGRVYRYLGRGPSRPASAGARVSRPAGGGAGATTNIGTIVVNTAANDADGIARDLPGAIRRRGLTTQANRGME